MTLDDVDVMLDHACDLLDRPATRDEGVAVILAVCRALSMRRDDAEPVTAEATEAPGQAAQAERLTKELAACKLELHHLRKAEQMWMRRAVANSKEREVIEREGPPWLWTLIRDLDRAMAKPGNVLTSDVRTLLDVIRFRISENGERTVAAVDGRALPPRRALAEEESA